MTAQEIITFWFGVAFEEDVAIPPERRKLWFGGEPDTDRLIRDRFAGALARAADGEYQSWRTEPIGCLALILLCDQFPRNIFRDSPKAFGFDALALDWALSGMDAGLDLLLPAVGRAFFYLPLEHAENPVLQERSVAAFAGLREIAPPVQKEMFESFYEYALRHREIIVRFGRFPHRNAPLGRTSTPEERSFLTLPGSSF